MWIMGDANKLLHAHQKIIIFSGFSYLVIFSAGLSGSDDFVLFDWLETVLIRKCFMRNSNFAHKLNSQLWMETQL